MSTDDANNHTTERKSTLNYRAFCDGQANYTPEEQELVQWLWGYYNSAIARDSARLCRELGDYDWETQVRPVFSGRCPASIRQEIFEAVANLRNRELRRHPLVMTVVAQRIIQALDYARDNSRIVRITGPTGRGKTYTAQYWAAQNNHGRTTYIRVPSGCTRRGLVNMLCEARGVSHSGSAAECEQNLRRTLTPRNVLIIDEAGHTLPRSGRPGGTLELIRDLHDMSGCAVALIFTDVYLAEIKRGSHRAYYEQFLGRMEFPVDIQARPRRDEVRDILMAYFGDDVGEDLVDDMIKVASAGDGQLRILYSDLSQAETIARKMGRKVTPADLRGVVKWRRSAGAWPEDK